MHSVTHTADLDVPVQECFAFIEDHTRVPDWLFAVESYVPNGAQTSGLGAVIDVKLKLGPIPVSSVLKVVDWAQGERIEMDIVDGPIKGSFVWTFETAGDGTRLTAAVSYSLVDGLVGRSLAKAINALLGQAIERTEAGLRRELAAQVGGPAPGY